MLRIGGLHYKCDHVAKDHRGRSAGPRSTILVAELGQSDGGDVLMEEARYVASSTELYADFVSATCRGKPRRFIELDRCLY